MTITAAQITKAQPTILVVRNDAHLLFLIRIILSYHGYQQLLMAEDGQEGLDLYLQNIDSIALVMTGLLLPKMDGPTMIRAILNRNPNQNIAICSGIPGGADSDVVKCMMFLGVKHFIPLPWPSNEYFVRSIRTCLGETEDGDRITRRHEER